ncbi:MAG: chemotaxis protein CheB [Alcanivorax sp.]|nr:chemotaxis protein CheB [Alcanivorax sp.]
MTPANPRIGIIADTRLQAHLLASAVKGQGYEVVLLNTDPANLEPGWLAQAPDLWVVDLSHEDRWQQFLDDLLENAAAPILFCDGQAPARIAAEYPRWERRLLAKLLDYVGKPRIREELETLVPAAAPARPIATPREFESLPRGQAPEQVWVLGASLGGPAAVKQFLDCLPPELPVAFFLAQHIDGGFLDTLAKVLCRDNGFHCDVGRDGMALQAGQVLLAPVDYEVTFTGSGQLCSSGKPWEGPYSPSIDQAIQNVSMAFGARAGAILFSGMGNDGAIAAPAMAATGAPVWAQSADSCAVSSQPDASRDTGCVSYSGDPEQLARQLVEHVRRAMSPAAGHPTPTL